MVAPSRRSATILGVLLFTGGLLAFAWRLADMIAMAFSLEDLGRFSPSSGTIS
jgi:hypothetical protein